MLIKKEFVSDSFWLLLKLIHFRSPDENQFWPQGELSGYGLWTPIMLFKRVAQAAALGAALDPRCEKLCLK